MSKQDPSDSTILVDDVIRAAAHLAPELEEALNEHGLTRPSYLVLLALLRAPDEKLTQRELMASVQRTSGTLSVRLARLERAGYVERERDPDDRRGAIVTLTDRGRRRVEAARPAYEDTAARLARGPAGDHPATVPPGPGPGRRRPRAVRAGPAPLVGLLRARRPRRAAPRRRRRAGRRRAADAP